ncbi:hypothetical protein GCM10009547_13280 [Sporichthya brevicatena]|uniref:HTH tetR-type domain-containing protein n=1 Tax=Sporichthya brevicatena TaxID=171442 RepID=A0ABP3RMR7_9ACTN
MPKQGRSGSTTGARRRTAAEVEQLLLESARHLFATQGYAHTTTRQIAARAGVHEPTVYRRFGSKAGLYRAAVLLPFGEVINNYLATWSEQISNPAPLSQLIEDFVGPLYRLLRDHAELTMALVQGRSDLTAGTGEVSSAQDAEDSWPSEIGQILQQLVPQLELEGARRGLHVDPATTNVVVLGMVMGVALLDPMLPTSAVHTTPDKMRQAMVELILHGVSPATSATAPLPTDAPVTAQLLLELHERVVAAERRAARAEHALAQCAERLTAAESRPSTPGV